MNKRPNIPIMVMVMCIGGMMVLQRSAAQTPMAEAIKGATKKVIKAIDLQIQRQQNKVLWLQDAQKTLENTMSKWKLDQIAAWTRRQKQLYQDYFEELRMVKSAISTYRRVKDILQTQERLVQEYAGAWKLFKQDDHFLPEERDYMQQVYTGILDESVQNLDELSLVINAFRTQMSDAQRLALIDAVGNKIDHNYTDLRTFNRGNRMLALQRTHAKAAVTKEKKIYGLP